MLIGLLEGERGARTVLASEGIGPTTLCAKLPRERVFDVPPEFRRVKTAERDLSLSH
jgi:hypothetical protein